MKKIFVLFILTLVGSVILFGCTSSTDNRQDGDSSDVNDGTDINGNENQDSTDDNSTNDGDTNNDSVDNGNGNITNLPEVGNDVGYLLDSVTLETLSGESVSTDDYRGKILILNIWATWCGPCKKELPDFNDIATEYKDKVVIIAAHTPSGSENAQDYVDLNFPATDIIFAYDTADSQAYLAAGGDIYVPQTAIADENGVIIYSDSGVLTYEQLVNIIEKQLTK